MHEPYVFQLTVRDNIKAQVEQYNLFNYTDPFMSSTPRISLQSLVSWYYKVQATEPTLLQSWAYIRGCPPTF